MILTEYNCVLYRALNKFGPRGADLTRQLIKLLAVKRTGFDNMGKKPLSYQATKLNKAG